MHLFGHHHDAPVPATQQPGGPVPQQAAATQGWQPVSGQPLTSGVHYLVHDTARAMYGRPRSATAYLAIGATTYRDAYRASLDGRTVVVANAFTAMEAGFFEAGHGTPVVAVAAVEIPTILGLICVQSRRYPHVMTSRENPTGDAAFDQRFQVAGAGDVQALLTDGVRRAIMSRDDWVILFAEYFVVGISKGAYPSGDAVNERVGEMLLLVAALPPSLVPWQVDHSADDLVARIDRIEGIEDAIVFLQGLTPAERETLARSQTPLAAFADVRTPQEAMARFGSLDMQARMQLMAMFTRVRDR